MSDAIEERHRKVVEKIHEIYARHVAELQPYFDELYRLEMCRPLRVEITVEQFANMGLNEPGYFAQSLRSVFGTHGREV